MVVTLSLIIPTKNCVDRIEGCVLPWRGIANEIIVVDQFSSDGTADVARKLGCKILQNEPDRGNFNINRKLGMEHATSDWLLYLDSDERPTPELLQEIRAFLNDDKLNSMVSGVRIPNLFYFLGKPLRHGLYRKSGAEIRMMKKGFWDYPAEKGIHYGVSVEGKTLRFKNPYKHFNINALSEWFIKTNQYTEHDAQTEAQELLRSGTKPKTYGAFWDAFRFFMRHYFYKLGFLDGFRGLVSVFYFMLYHLTQRVKVWEKMSLLELEEEADFIRPIEVKHR